MIMVKLWLVMNLTNRHLLNCLYKELGRRNIMALDNGETIDIDKNDFSFVKDGKHIYFDYAYITIHGQPWQKEQSLSSCRSVSCSSSVAV